MVESSLSNTIVLKNGRTLGYACFGNPADFPVLFFHGIPGSRLQRPLDLDYLGELSLCIYCIERPGIGLSTPVPVRTIQDWVDDINQFCEAKAFNAVAVAGISGGSPYAFALAFHRPDLVKSITIISGMPPLFEDKNFKLLPARTRLIFSFAHNLPGLAKIMTNSTLYLINNRIDRLFPLILRMLPDADKVLLTEPAVMDLFKEDVEQAFINGTAAAVQEISLLRSAWEFDPKAITQPVNLFHGYKDTVLPIDLAEELIKSLKNVRPYLYPEEGHFFALKTSRKIFEIIKNDIELV